VKRKVRVGGLNFWAFEVAWAANWHAGKKSSSNDERTRSFTETLLNRRTWIEILPAATASCRGCGGRPLAIICTHSLAETRFEPVAMAREKDNRRVTTFGSEALLEFETIQVRRRYIKDETARNGGSRTGEEFVCGCERLRLATSGADQQLDPTHTKVSINTFVQYARFFSCGLIATVIPSKGNLATDSSSEGSSQ
jgi:hypothetical protein